MIQYKVLIIEDDLNAAQSIWMARKLKIPENE